jgi:hypothetical protein
MRYRYYFYFFSGLHVLSILFRKLLAASSESYLLLVVVFVCSSSVFTVGSHNFLLSFLGGAHNFSYPQIVNPRTHRDYFSRPFSAVCHHCQPHTNVITKQHTAAAQQSFLLLIKKSKRDYRFIKTIIFFVITYEHHCTKLYIYNYY